MNREELEQALKVIESALGIIRQPLKPQDEINLNNTEKRLIHYFRQSSAEGRDAILSVAETLAEQAKKETHEPLEARKVA